MIVKPSGPNVYERAVEAIRERGWCQHALEASNGAVCLLGAYAAAAGLYNDRGELRYPAPDEERALAKAIRSAGFEWRSGSVEPWNDAPDRTVEDVLLVLKHAAVEFDA